MLRFDPTGKADHLAELIAKAGKGPLTADEQKTLAEALKNHQPWLEWTGKREAEEKGYFEVDPVALHIHERVSTQAILRAAKREDIQRDLFADPQEDWRETVKWYQHDIDWTNRLILGDSLQVMTSLATRENLAGQVQMIYMDPPYGINFKSNFQSELGKRDVKEKDKDLSREPEMVQAYRDTWNLGVHSYLAYMRNRLEASKSLLHASGSIFVQISEENLHLVRNLLDEVMKPENFVSVISFQTTSGFADAKSLSRLGDYILWFAKDITQLKYYPLYDKQDVEPGSLAAGWVLTADGEYRGTSSKEDNGERKLPEGSRLYKADNILSQGAASEPQPYVFQGKLYEPSSNNHWKPSFPIGINRLGKSGRIHVAKNSIQYRRFADDFPYTSRGNIWTDTLTGSFTDDKVYVVQTSPKVIERCLLMTTEPGDLVLDPTCGSGTTAFVAEEWGRRWITIDTSRVASSVARQRFMTAKFPIFASNVPTNGVMINPGSGFALKKVPHIKLQHIAQNTNLDPIFAKHEPILDAALVRCNSALAQVTSELRSSLRTKLETKQRAEGKSSITDADERRWILRDRFEHWEVPFDTEPTWPQDLQLAVKAYRTAWRAKMDEVNKCIADNADQEELVDDPVVLPGVRVSGPFTVEGVMPIEEGELAGEPEDLAEDPYAAYDASRNVEAYLESMLAHLKSDGVTFPGNLVRKFRKLEPVWNSGFDQPWHAEGWWQEDDEAGGPSIAIAFGPPYGPLTARTMEDLMRRVGRSFSQLVVAAFNFDPETVEVIEDEASHPRLTIHKAFIRPDINPGMDGLLKDSPRSQLFTVFGKPEVEVHSAPNGEWQVELLGVDIYDPLTGDIRPTKADKVAAWFLDSDYDGRCFCVTQAFFPDQDAWEKIAKALKTQADQYAFAPYKGTKSVTFKAGTHGRVAVKVIDPRGNEVMVVKKLGEA
ncbi:MAG: site-specific DNA-methyltransferase [Spirochaetales bacterium]